MLNIYSTGIRINNINYKMRSFMQMKKLLQTLTNKMITKKGVWLTLAVWIVAAAVLSVVAPGSKEYSVNNVSKLYPETSPSEVAQQKVDEYFKDDDGMPAIFVLEANDGSLDEADIQEFSAQVQEIGRASCRERVKKTEGTGVVKN